MGSFAKQLTKPAFKRNIPNPTGADMKKNDSVELKLKLNAQMLKILSELGIKPSQGEGGDDEL